MDDVYDVELRLVGIDRGSREAISQLYVRTRGRPEPTARAVPTASRPTGPATQRPRCRA